MVDYKRKSAHEKIRTSTNLRLQPPQGCASTNFATCAFNKIKMLSNCLTFFCDRAGARTQDPLLKREMLYQLSYQVYFCKPSANILSIIGIIGIKLEIFYRYLHKNTNQ